MDYTELQDKIAKWLNRGDLVEDIPDFITFAEDRLRRDPRVKKQTCRGTFTITADGDALPTDFRAIDAWYYDGAGDVYGAIEIVPMDKLAELKALYGTPKRPEWAGIADGRLYYAPVPGESYTTKMSYFRKVTRLSSSNTTNWLLDEHSDIYLYAALCESAPFLKEDPRLATWETVLEQRLEKLNLANWEAQFSGTMSRQRHRPIGG